ncbi:MAG: DNA import protein CedA [Sulfolobaceae archaeon]
MYSPIELLYIAQNLAILTYFLGVLLYALPIPIYGIKKWAPKLVSDGIYASVWVNIYAGILYMISLISNIIGISWDSYFLWLRQVLGFELNLYLIIRATAATASVDPALSVLVAPFTLFMSFMTGLITLLQTIIIISEIVYQYTPIFISLGILLLSIPFRIGRGIGASLIASFTIFYIGLPYLPEFLNNLNMNILSLPPPSTDQPQDLINLLATQIVPQIIAATIVMPLIYITILAGLSIGLAYAISGTGGRLPFPIDIL